MPKPREREETPSTCGARLCLEELASASPNPRGLPKYQGEPGRLTAKVPGWALQGLGTSEVEEGKEGDRGRVRV